MAQKDMEKAEALKAEVADLKERMHELETQDRAIGEELQAMLLAIQNLLAEDVHIGQVESANIELARPGEPPRFDFKPPDHADLDRKRSVLGENGSVCVSFGCLCAVYKQTKK